MGQKDPYAVLKLSPGAELSEIEAAYWLLALRYKAALGTDPDAPRLLGDLNQAYESLTTAQPHPRFDEPPRRIPANPPKRDGTRQPRRLSAWMIGSSRSPEEQVETEARVQREEAAVLATSGVTRPSDVDPAFGPSAQPGTAEQDRAPDGAGKTGIPERKPSRPSFLRRLGWLWQHHPLAVDKKRVLARAERAAGLRASTAATVAHWRKSAVPPGPPEPPTLQPPNPLPPDSNQS